MSRLERTYEKLKRVEEDFVESDSKIHSIAKYLNRLESDYYEAITTSSRISIEDKLIDYYESEVRVDSFLSSADDNICEELRAIQADIKNQDEENRRKVENTFGGFFK